MATIVIKDKNLVPQNIKKGVTILKVTGTLEGGGGINNQDKTVSSSTSNQTVTYDSGYTGLGTVTVNKYTLDSKTVDPSTSQQTVNSSADGLSSVTVNAVTSSIDGNIQAGNIKKDVTILGVTGTYESTPVQPVLQDVSVSYSQNGSYTLEASSGYDGLGTVDIDVSVASQGGGDWVMKGIAGTLTDLSPYTVGDDVLNKPYAMAYMFWACNTLTKAPVIDASVISGDNAMYYAFNYCTSLTDASFPKLTTVSGSNTMRNAFNNTAITSVSFPELTTVSGSNAMQYIFSNCTSLTSASFPKLTTIDGMYTMANVFSSCTSLTSVSFPELTTISKNYSMESVFYGCNHLTSISFPKLTSINGNYSLRSTFQNCTSLTDASFPELTTVSGSNAMNNIFENSSLTSISFPKLTSVSYLNNAFKGCTSLTSASLPNVSSYDSVTDAFSGCTNLTTLEISPIFLTANGSTSLLYNVSSIVNLTVNGTITDNVYLLWQPNLSESSVYDLLTALDLSVSGKTVQFYSGGLTVTDYQDGRIQTAYDAAVAAGWTISNLTIVQPEPEPEPESEPCPVCGGTGIDPETGETCSTCDGSGVIS